MLNGKNEKLEIKKQVFPPFRYFDFRINYQIQRKKNLKLLPGNKFIFKGWRINIHSTFLIKKIT